MDSNKKIRKLVRRKSNSDTNFSQENLVQEPKLQRKSANIQEFGTQNNQSIVNKNILIFVLVIVIVLCFYSIINSINKSSRRSSIPSNYNSSYSSSNYTYSSTSSTSNSTDTNVIDISDDYTEVTLDKNVLKQLGYDVYSEYSSCDLIKNGEILSSFDIPASYEYNGNKYKITKIGDGVFSWSSSLKNITIPNSVVGIGSRAFFRCRLLKSITIPQSVIIIEDEAFYLCDSLESVTISDDVQYIGTDAFKDIPIVYYNGSLASGTPWGAKKVISNKKISSINKTSSQPPNLDQKIKYTEVVLDKKVLYQLGYNPADKKKFTSVKIPYTYKFKGKNYKITKIGEKAFYNYGSLQKVIIDEGVQILGVSSFENCIGLTTVKLPNTINKINNNAFANCKALKTINLPDGLTELRDSIFFNCISLRNIDIPSSITKIGDMVFYKCKSLENIKIPENVTSIGQSAFAGCKGLKDLKIPSSVTTIKQWAFSNCVSLNRIDVPDTVTSIGEEAFANVGYVYYDGLESGQPWGALDSNKLPEIPFTLDDLWEKSLNNVNLGKFFGKSTRYENFYLKFKDGNKYRIPARWYGDSLMLCLSNDCGSPYIVSVLCCARNGLKTNAGIQVGDSESKLLKAYRNRLTKTKNGYYYVLPCDAEYTYSIYYHIKDGRVRKMYIGRYFEPNSESSIFSKLYEEIAKAEGF